MWIIASIPFWLLSFALLAGVLIGMVAVHRKIDTIGSEDFRHVMTGFAVALIASGFFGYIAARIAS